MRTTKTLPPGERIIYQPEIRFCPACKGPLKLANYLLWDKTIQTLNGPQSIASRPAHCSEATCEAGSLAVRSAQAQQLALPGLTYGNDVLVRLGWERQTHYRTYAELQAQLLPTVQISQSQIRRLYQQVYLPLLACQERHQLDRLAVVARQYNGLFIALDGLAPEAGEPQLWCIREVITGLTLRAGWLSRQDQATFEAFLRPLLELDWPIKAVLSDKQQGLVPAVASVLPTSLHQFCQSHYLNNLAEPWGLQDEAFKTELRRAVRAELGPLLRQVDATDPASGEPAPQVGVMTVTGLLASPLPVNPLPLPTTQTPLSLPPSLEPELVTTAIVTAMLSRVRYLLTLKGRPPKGLAGLETYYGLRQVLEVSQDLLKHRPQPGLASLVKGLAQILTDQQPGAAVLTQGACWLETIAAILRPSDHQPTSPEQVQTALFAYLASLGPTAAKHGSPLLEFHQHLLKVSRSYEVGLFHTYGQAGLPRTNNGLESRFRQVQQSLLRTTGQRGQTRRHLHRHGAWELLSRPATPAEYLSQIGQISLFELRQEQQRHRQHQQRFRFHTRSYRQSMAQLEGLRQKWHTLPQTSTG